MKECPSAQFVDRAVLHRSRGTAREYQPHMLYVAARRAHTGSDVEGPFPSRLVCGTADGHTPETDEFELSFFERSQLIGCFKMLQNCLDYWHTLGTVPSTNKGWSSVAGCQYRSRNWELRTSSRSSPSPWRRSSAPAAGSNPGRGDTSNKTRAGSRCP